jgi:hypothetical protein
VPAPSEPVKTWISATFRWLSETPRAFWLGFLKMTKRPESEQGTSTVLGVLRPCVLAIAAVTVENTYSPDPGHCVLSAYAAPAAATVEAPPLLPT